MNVQGKFSLWKDVKTVYAEMGAYDSANVFEYPDKLKMITVIRTRYYRFI